MSTIMRRTIVLAGLLILHGVYSQERKVADTLTEAASSSDAERARAAKKILAERSVLLGVAATNGRSKTVRALIESGADVNRATRGGWTALMGAADEGHLEIVKYLVSKGADIHAKTRQGRTALIRSAYHGKAKIVQYLLSVGANVNEADRNGVTALMLAAQKGHDKTVEVLLAAGANRLARTNQDKSAIAFAKEAVAMHEKEIRQLSEEAKQKPSGQEYYEKSSQDLRRHLTASKRTLTLLSNPVKEKLGRLIGKVFKVRGKKLEIMGEGIAGINAGTRLRIRSTKRDIVVTVTEVLHSKLKAIAAVEGVVKGDHVYVEK